MVRNGDPKKILLGAGIFKIGDTPVGLTEVEANSRMKENIDLSKADGDKGTVKGRVVQEGSTPKLKFTSLEVISPSLPKYYPGIKNS